MYIYIYTHMHAYIHTYRHTHIHICIYIYKCYFWKQQFTTKLVIILYLPKILELQTC